MSFWLQSDVVVLTMDVEEANRDRLITIIDDDDDNGNDDDDGDDDNANRDQSELNH